MQAFTILAKVLGASHEPAHLFEYSYRTRWNLVPSPLKAMDWSSTKRRYNGS
jgi:hypothetical protein